MKQKILIVDDEKNVRNVIQRAFSQEYSVFTASEGISAMEIIKQEQPALIFLDIGMPGMSGLEVLKLIKKAGLSSVIWMLTGEEDINIAMKTIQMGASGYLTKPFEIEKIREIARDVIMNYERKAKRDSSADKPWVVDKEQIYEEK
ncbi:MAG: response regulator [Elusimicrobia bacterium]|nr:response regulator [Elusimicrobiota bacterium]